MSQTKAQLISDLVQALNFTGTSSAPANGVYLSAANTIKLATASTERLKIDGTELVVNDTGASVDFRIEGDTETNLLFVDASAEKIGIGTSSPNARLVVYRKTVNASNPVLEVRSDHDTTNSIKFSIDGDGEAFFSDNVGIGTNSPDTLLHLSGADTAVIRLENTDDSLTTNQLIGGLEFEKIDPSGAGVGVVGGLRMYSGVNGITTYLTLSTSNATTNNEEHVRITSDGYVGIGTTSPNTKLDIVSSPLNATTVNTTTCKQLGLWINPNGTGDNTTGNIYNGIALSDGFAGLYGYDGGASAATGLGVFTGNASAVAERMRIDPSGNVGIGTTSPGGFNPHAQELVVHDADGTCGITISTPNDTVGRLAFADPEDDNVGEVRYTHSANTMEFTVNAAERMRIDSNGMIGIGNIAPKTANTFNAIEIGSGGFIGSQTSAKTIELASNAYYNSGWKYKHGSIAASQYYQYQGYHAFTTAASGSADGAITFTERMRIDSGGRVIVGGGAHAGGANLVVKGIDGETLNSYAAAAFCRIGANPTSGTSLANLRFSGGATGVNRAAEITVKADSNWNDGTSQESKMIFTVASSGGGNTAGNPLLTLKGTGDVEVNRGNLVIADTKGIDFSDHGNAGGMTSELLDDYEEGTCTTTLNATDLTLTSNTYTSVYTRVGRLVHVSGYATGVTPADISGYVANTTHSMQIGGLPFTNYNSIGARGAASIGVNTGFTISTNHYLSNHGNANATTISIWQEPDTAGTRIGPVLYTGTTINIHFCFTYNAA